MYFERQFHLYAAVCVNAEIHKRESGEYAARYPQTGIDVVALVQKTVQRTVETLPIASLHKLECIQEAITGFARLISDGCLQFAHERNRVEPVFCS